MKCAKCDHEMVEGTATLGGYNFFGADGLDALNFKAPYWPGHVMQEVSDVLPAHYCDHCGAMLIETGRRGLSSLE